MKTIKQVLADFLKEQRSRLKSRTYGGYEDAMHLFEQCLNSYAYEGLDEEDRRLFDRVYEQEKKEFCEIFGPDKIGFGEIGQFLGYFMIRKVMASKELMKTVGKVMRRFVKWMNDNGYMSEEKYKNAAETIDDLKDELPKVSELADLIFDYIEDTAPVDSDQAIEGYFKVTKIEPGKLWLEDQTGPEEEVGPVQVSSEITSKCKLGWVISLELGKTKKGWRMLESGNVYPE